MLLLLVNQSKNDCNAEIKDKFITTPGLNTFSGKRFDGKLKQGNLTAKKMLLALQKRHVLMKNYEKLTRKYFQIKQNIDRLKGN